MKNLYLLTWLSVSLLLFTNITVIAQTSLFRAKPSNNISKQQRPVSLPFVEDWSTTSFETNNWTTECDNWEINNQQGNPGPTAEFKWDPMLQNDYSCSLVSDIIIGSQIHVGQIFFNFDIKLDNRNNTGTELLIVEVFDGINWEVLTTFSNDLGFDWGSNHFDITEQARSNNFQIRFRATGQNSYNILSWFVDNISVYRSCAAPYNLLLMGYWNSGLDFGSVVEWDAPDILYPPQSAWLHWDYGSMFSGVGLMSGGNFSVAARWDVGQLSNYENDTIKKVRIHLNDTSFQNIVLKIWKGENANEQIYKDTLSDVTYENWMEIPIDTILLIPENEELWVGYSIIEQMPSYFPAGTDSGPAIAGYGDMITTDGIEWNTLSGFGLDYNWNIQVYIETPESADTASMLGFNVFRKLPEEPDYTFRSFVPYTGEQHHEFREPMVDDDFNVCYKVNGVWGLQGDTCISNYALDIDLQWNSVCIFTANIQETECEKTNIYPNPATNKLTISTNNEIPIKEIYIYNQLGQNVLYISSPPSLIDVSSLVNGMYTIEIITNEYSIRKKLMIK